MEYKFASFDSSWFELTRLWLWYVLTTFDDVTIKFLRIQIMEARFICVHCATVQQYNRQLFTAAMRIFDIDDNACCHSIRLVACTPGSPARLKCRSIIINKKKVKAPQSLDKSWWIKVRFSFVFSCCVSSWNDFPVCRNHLSSHVCWTGCTSNVCSPASWRVCVSPGTVSPKWTMHVNVSKWMCGSDNAIPPSESTHIGIDYVYIKPRTVECQCTSKYYCLIISYNVFTYDVQANNVSDVDVSWTSRFRRHSVRNLLPLSAPSYSQPVFSRLMFHTIFISIFWNKKTMMRKIIEEYISVTYDADSCSFSEFHWVSFNFSYMAADDSFDQVGTIWRGQNCTVYTCVSPENIQESNCLSNEICTSSNSCIPGKQCFSHYLLSDRRLTTPASTAYEDVWDRGSWWERLELSMSPTETLKTKTNCDIILLMVRFA